MKKLIALAVAAAAMPAMAAVSISGAIEVSYSNKDAGTATGLNGGASAAVAQSKTIGTEQATLSVAASSEMDNGMTVSTSYTFKGAGDAVSNDGGEGAITVAGAFGSLSVGDVAGPLDARDGQAAATAENDLSAAFGGDMSVVYTLPAMVDGLNISVGGGAKNGGDTGVGNSASGVAFDYSVAGFKVYAGSESKDLAAVTAVTGKWLAAGGTTIQTGKPGASDTGAQVLVANVDAKAKGESDVTGYGASYSINGFTVAMNAAENKVKRDGSAEVKYEAAAMGVSYNMGNLTVAYNTREDEKDGAVIEDQNTVSASYTLGGGASVYAASSTRDKGKNDETTVGIKFAF